MQLQHLTTGCRLIQPLRSWLRQPYQNWQWFHDTVTDTIYERVEPDSWRIHHRIRINYGQRRPIYGDPEDSDQQPQLEVLYPTTPIKQRDGYLRSQTSMTTFPEPTLHPDKSLWNLASVPPVFSDTPPFYQCLIGDRGATTNARTM